jgi:RES domain-containing protein
MTIPRRTVVWRAQQGCAWKAFDGTDLPTAFQPERMKPLPDSAKEGRANAKGIPCLYVATDKETAMSEVRPWIGSFVSVAALELRRDFVIVNCTAHRFGFYYREPTAEKREVEVWARLGILNSRYT